MKEQVAIAPKSETLAARPKSLSEFWAETVRIMKQVEKRAFELFEFRGRQDGCDLDDWLKAEKELLAPTAVKITEKGDKIFINAELPGFNTDEIKLNLEPGLLTLQAACEKHTETKQDKTMPIRSESRYIFQKVSLPMEVVPEEAVATLRNGVLEIVAPKKALTTAARTISINAA